MGARLIELFPRRDVGIIITAAILLALLLLFTKVKQAIEQSQAGPVRFGLREVLFFFGIGVWLGFIVLDGATFPATSGHGFKSRRSLCRRSRLRRS